MWYGPFYAVGWVAGQVARAGTLQLRSQRDQAGRERRGERGSGLYALMAKALGRGEARLSRAALAAAVKTGRVLMDRPSVRTSIEAAVAKIVGSTNGASPPAAAVRKTADRVALVLQEQDIVPNRIGVDGLPGSGKSSLTHALAERLDMDRKSLDHENMNVPRDFTQERTIFEHHRLFRTQDVDVFDVLVYVDEPVEVSKARVLQRAKEEMRESLIVYVLDYEKLKNIGKLAFDACAGEPILISGTNLIMKIRPAEGFHAEENIESRLRGAAHDPQDMTKEEMLFLLGYGKPRSGLMAYVVPGAFNDELLQGLLAGMRGYLAQ